MKRIIPSLTILMFLSLSLTSQNEVDALRYSRTTFGGSARVMAMGGAFGSLGADFSTLSTNPAGIGLFKKSEFMFSPSLYIGETKSTYNGSQSGDSKHNFNMGNVGIVFTTKSANEKSVLRYYHFGFGLNRLNDFNRRIRIEGTNNENSITDMWVDYANGVHFQDIEDDFYGDYAYDLHPAWQTYLIDTVPGYYDRYNAAAAGGHVLQKKNITSWGSMNEMVVSGGANLSDRLYFGATIGFPFIRYFEESTYGEVDEDNNFDDFHSLDVYQYLKTRGSGVNLKFGLIARPINWLRIGAAIHSPTWYNNMQDIWYTEVSSRFDNNETFSSASPEGRYDYQLETPFKAIGSVSVVLWRIALISADYEYIDYSESKLRASDYYFDAENAAIRLKYTQTQNIRLGTEIRFGHFAVRGGAAIYGSPFASGINDGETYYYSGGFGYREKHFYFDLSYTRGISNEDYYLYGSENVRVNPVSNQLISNNVVATLGFRF
ncbi:MAG: hypothetical protein DRJ05_03590 [Bacteroidetes bacterium]|nr:MAG: hypothetical protein DRJ05_03590 [Bacteroidota bacterium]